MHPHTQVLRRSNNTLVASIAIILMARLDINQPTRLLQQSFVLLMNTKLDFCPPHKLQCKCDFKATFYPHQKRGKVQRNGFSNHLFIVFLKRKKIGHFRQPSCKRQSTVLMSSTPEKSSSPHPSLLSLSLSQQICPTP